MGVLRPKKGAMRIAMLALTIAKLFVEDFTHFFNWQCDCDCLLITGVKINKFLKAF